MKKVLILSLHFPPDSIIAARRSEAYARYFVMYGIHPTIVTDLFEKVFDQNGNWIGIKDHVLNDKPAIQNFETHTVIRIPRFINRLQRVQNAIEGTPVISKSFVLGMNALGFFEMRLIYAYYSYRRFLWEHLKNNYYDLVLVVDSPHFQLKLAYEIEKQFNVPFVCDSRDLYDNDIIGDFYRPNLSRWLRNFFYKGYFSKWLSKAMFITCTSKPWAKYYGKISGRPYYTITNGFDLREFESYRSKEVNSSTFTVAHFGTLYPEQDISIFIHGVRSFLEGAKPSDFKLRFIGLKTFNYAQVALIKENIIDSYLDLQERIEREEVLAQLVKTTLLYYPAWTTTRGVYSGKIFEYLGAYRPILLCPGNNDVVEELIVTTQAGIIANTADEVSDLLHRLYKEWKTTKEVRYYGVEKEIINYTREEQVKKMAGLILKHTDNDESR